MGKMVAIKKHLKTPSSGQAILRGSMGEIILDRQVSEEKALKQKQATQAHKHSYQQTAELLE